MGSLVIMAFFSEPISVLLCVCDAVEKVDGLPAAGNVMGSFMDLVRQLRQIIWASLTGGWYYDPYHK